MKFLFILLFAILLFPTVIKAQNSSIDNTPWICDERWKGDIFLLEK